MPSPCRLTCKDSKTYQSIRVQATDAELYQVWAELPAWAREWLRGLMVALAQELRGQEPSPTRGGRRLAVEEILGRLVPFARPAAASTSPRRASRRAKPAKSLAS